MTKQQWHEVIDAMANAHKELWRLASMLDRIDSFDAQRVDSMIVDMEDLIDRYERLEGSEYIEEE